MIFLTQCYLFNDTQLIKSVKTSKIRHIHITVKIILRRTSIVINIWKCFKFQVIAVRKEIETAPLLLNVDNLKKKKFFGNMGEQEDLFLTS